MNSNSLNNTLSNKVSWALTRAERVGATSCALRCHAAPPYQGPAGGTVCARRWSQPPVCAPCRCLGRGSHAGRARDAGPTLLRTPAKGKAAVSTTYSPGDPSPQSLLHPMHSTDINSPSPPQLAHTHTPPDAISAAVSEFCCRPLRPSSHRSSLFPRTPPSLPSRLLP